MDAVDDPDGVGKMLIGDVPDQGRAISQHDAPSGSLETTPCCLALAPCRTHTGQICDIPLRRALDGGRVGV